MFYMNCFIWTCGVTKVYDKNGELGSTKILRYETLLYSKTFCNFVYMTKHFFLHLQEQILQEQWGWNW